MGGAQRENSIPGAEAANFMGLPETQNNCFHNFRNFGENSNQKKEVHRVYLGVKTGTSDSVLLATMMNFVF